MATKDVPEDISRNEALHRQKMQEEEAKTRQEIERRIQNIGKCFETVILPAVRSVENDLKLAGYGHQVTISHFTGTDALLVRQVLFYFFPDRSTRSDNTQKSLAAACNASITATGDYRKLTFSIHFPRRLPPVVETEEIARSVGDVIPPVVDAFLEKFIKGAIDVFQSDRVLL